MMSDKFKDDATPQFPTKCGMCGHAIQSNEIGGMIEGSFIDYTIEKGNGEISVDFCTDCWIIFFNNCMMDLTTAIAKRRAAQSLEGESPYQFHEMVSNEISKIHEVDRLLEELNV